MSVEPLKLLVVDSNAVDRLSLRQVLKVSKRSYIIYETDTADIARTLLDEHPFDCIILNDHLVDIDGLDFLTYLKEEEVILPIIITADVGSDSMIVEAMTRGAHNFVSKSQLSLETIESAIETSLRLARLEFRSNKLVESLERKNIRLQEAQASRSRLLANISHELRGAIHGSLGTLELIAQSNLDMEQNEQIGDIRLGVENSMSIIGDLLDYSVLESTDFELEILPFSIRDIVEKEIRDLKARALLKKTKISLKVESLVPELLEGDPERVRFVIHRLIRNAIHFSNEGEVQVLISTRVVKQGLFQVIVEVSDQGEGISEERLPYVFEPFYLRDQTLSNKFGGTGLGMTICKKLSSLLGGNLQVASQLGKGTTFIFDLTLEESSAAGATPRPSSLEMDEQFAVNYPLDVLVVEDDEVASKVAVGYLKKLGYTADRAKNGVEALELYANKKYGLILMDIQMPKMDGIEATQHILQIAGSSSPPAIIALTAKAMMGDRKRCLNAGMSDYLVKPLSLTSLAVKIENLFLGGVLLEEIMEEKTVIEAESAYGPEAPLELYRKTLLDRFGGEGELLKDTASSFVLSQKRLMDPVYRAVQGKQSIELRRAAHRLKGSASTFMANEIEEICQNIEELASHEKWDDIQLATDVLSQKMDDFIPILEKLIAFQKVAA